MSGKPTGVGSSSMGNTSPWGQSPYFGGGMGAYRPPMFGGYGGGGLMPYGGGGMPYGGGGFFGGGMPYGGGYSGGGQGGFFGGLPFFLGSPFQQRPNGWQPAQQPSPTQAPATPLSGGVTDPNSAFYGQNVGGLLRPPPPEPSQQGGSLVGDALAPPQQGGGSLVGDALRPQMPILRYAGY